MTHDPREFWEHQTEVRRAAAALVEAEPVTLEVLEPSRPAVGADLNASLSKTIAWLALYGFWSASQVTKVLEPQEAFKSGERAGEEREDKVHTNVFIHAAHPDLRHVSIWYQNGALSSARLRSATRDWYGTEKVGELLAFIEGEEI